MGKKTGYLVSILAGLILGLALVWLVGRIFPAASPDRSTPLAATVAAGPANQPAASSPLPYQNNAITQAAVQPPRPTPPPAIGGEYIALGDSVAYGIGAPDPNGQGYAGLFYANYLKRVQPDLLAYRNLAVPGETSSSFLAVSNGKSQLQRFQEEIAAAAKAGLRVSPVTLTIGGNDILAVEGKSNSEREAALARFDTNLSRILSEIKTQIGQADLLVTTYYNPLAYNTGGNDIESDWFRRFDGVIRQRVQEKGAKIVDFTSPVAGNEKNLTWITSNDVHPTPTGHAVLAEAVWQAAGYDTTPPRLTLTYSPVAENGSVSSNSRLVFKVAATDDWSFVLNSAAETDQTPGAGKLAGAWVTLDDNPRSPLNAVPARYARVPTGGQEFDYILDTSLLAPGKHTLKFEATDTADNTAPLEISFTQL
jgi:lysophospholipase L1-like esterase